MAQGKLIDLTGREFGRLRVATREENSRAGQARWRCICECGGATVAAGDDLRSGHTKSCGCERVTAALEMTSRNKTHGRWGTKLYIVWKSMLARCESPASHGYRYYGGRGIQVTDEWRSGPEVFIAWARANGWRRGLQLDRINNDGHYEPRNCRFVTASENVRNRPPIGTPRPRVERLR